MSSPEHEIGLLKGKFEGIQSDITETKDAVLRIEERLAVNTAGITDIVTVTQAEYDAITPSETTLYFIVGA